MMRSIFLAIIAIIFAGAQADDGPVGTDISIVVTNFSYLFDNIRSESLEAFESETTANHGGSYNIVVCSGTDPKRLASLVEFLEQHAPSAAIDIHSKSIVPPGTCGENES